MNSIEFTEVIIDGLETHNEKSSRDRQVRWVRSRISSKMMPLRSGAAKRTKHHRGTTCLVVQTKTTKAERRAWADSCAVKLIRIAPRALHDASESLPSALAAVRDGVADALEVDDRDAEQGGIISWSYGQEKGPYGVRVEIRATERPALPLPAKLIYNVTRSGRLRGGI